MHVGTHGNWTVRVCMTALNVCICIFFSFLCGCLCAWAAHVDMCVCVCVCVCLSLCLCLFPDVLQLEIKQASPLTPVLSLKSLIGPESLEHSSLSMIVLLFSSFCCFLSALWLCWLAGRQEGTSSPIVPAPGTQLWAKSVQNVKHRWPLTHKWVHGK